MSNALLPYDHDAHHAPRGNGPGRLRDTGPHPRAATSVGAIALVAAAAILPACGASTPHRATLDPHPPRYLAPRVAPPPADPRAQLRQADVVADVSLLVRTLDDAYGGRSFVTPATWSAFRRRLEEVAAGDRSTQAFCDALGSALTRLIEPGLYASLSADGARCTPRDGTRGGLPYTASPTGEGIAAHADALWAMRREGGSVVVLGIRRFEPRSAPGWAGFNRAVDEAVHAPAFVIDLRGAGGDDLAAVVPMLSALTGVTPLHPLAAIRRASGPTADALRSSMPTPAPPLPPSWQALVGPEGATTPAPARLMTVLVGEGCGEACELTARVLHAYGGATVVGTVDTPHRMPVGEPGLLVLPRSHLRVHVPTSAVVLNPRVARVTGDRDYWFDRHGFGATSPSTDALPGVVRSLTERLDARDRVARFLASPPPPCATLSPVARPDQLDATARARVRGPWEPREPQVISAKVDLPAAEAHAWVVGCPGVQANSALGEGPAIVFVSVRSFEALSRLAQAEVVEYVEIEPQPQVDVNVR